MAEAAAVLVGPVAIAGAMLGALLAKTRWWPMGFAVPLIDIALVILGHRSAMWMFAPAVSWAVEAPAGPLVMALLVPALFGTLMGRMPAARNRRVVGLLASCMVVYHGVLPLVCPLVVRGALASGSTVVDVHGICRQTHAYTCGPAAAVTCLNALGVQAQEGPLAIAAGCGPVVGTSPIHLAAAIEETFGASGIRSVSRYAAVAGEVKLPAVVEVFLPRAGGHYVALLEVHEADVVMGDPLGGRQRLSREQFEGEWRHTAVEIWKVPAER